ncbi:MAG: FeoA domain-containing protein [Zoogloeaceae bacterium]|jgi:ferrous iron transport protein A|nr:FeoA domain-containing protein [Zoogloeaceae bacterium]
MSIQFKDLQAGQTARVTGFARDVPDRAYRRKLLAMGLTRGVEFQVMRVAPMGDPVEIALRGFSLSLRKDEAAALEIELQ